MAWSSSSPTPTMSQNDGGIVLSIFLMVAALSYALFNAVAFYNSSTNKNPTTSQQRPYDLVRLLSDSANVGNCVIHMLLIIYTIGNADNGSEYWVKDRELGGVEGPVFLAILNFTAGLSAIRNYSMTFPLVWNR